MLYGIIADVHSNLEALDAVLDQLKGAESVICAGDLVGYGPNPNECIEKAVERSFAAVAGNHEKAVTGEHPTTYFTEKAKAAILWTRENITSENLEYCRKLPLILEEDDFQSSHGSLRSPLEEYISGIAEALPAFEKMTRPVCFMGHTHRPLFIARKHDGFYEGRLLLDGDEIFIEEYDRIIINVGAVGQPRDGDPRASFGIYNSKTKMFALHRVPYDIEKVQEKMQKAGLPQPLIDRLSFGR